MKPIRSHPELHIPFPYLERAEAKVKEYFEVFKCVVVTHFSHVHKHNVVHPKEWDQQQR